MSKRRWFVVRTGCIWYWQKEEDVAAKVAAKGVIRVTRVRPRSNGKGLAFDTPKGRTYFVMPEDPAVTQKLLAVFNLIAREDGGREATDKGEGNGEEDSGAVVEWLLHTRWPKECVGTFLKPCPQLMK